MRANAIYAANRAPTSLASGTRASDNQAYSPLRLGYAAELVRQRLTAVLSNLLQAVVTSMTNSSNLLVWPSKDATGQTVWNADDRTTGKVIRDISESEMRVWLERRYSTY